MTDTLPDTLTDTLPLTTTRPKLREGLPVDLLEGFRARAADLDRDNAYFDQDLRELRESGYLAAAVPTDLGGSGLSLAELAASQRRLARYAPATREWTTWPLPGDVPRAYAIYVDESDIVWVSDFGANAVLSFDPKSEQFTAYPSSADSADVRQILGRPGEVWLPESGTDRLMVIRTGG